jgi:assimilatory nitrate reductase catalytic subunit
VSVDPTLTHCPYCSLQCGILLTCAAGRGVQGGPSALAKTSSTGNRPRTLQPQHDFPTNRGGLCSKGWTAATLLDHPQRLLTPLVRIVPGDRSSEFRAASWDEALTLIVSKITELQAAHGSDAIGCFGGGGLTNEKAYAFGKFARVALRTSMIDYNGRFCMSSAATAANRAFGIDRGLPFPLADIAEAETILLIGSNPAATMPPLISSSIHVELRPRRVPPGICHHGPAPIWLWRMACFIS